MDTHLLSPRITGLRHKLDPLTAEEIERAAHLVRAAHDLGPGMRFETIVLREPQGGEADRRAFVCAYDIASGHLFEALVALDTGVVEGWTRIHGARPRIAPDEFLIAEDLAKADPRFVAGLARRGITDLSLVCVDPWSAGVFGHTDEVGRRIILCVVWVRSRPGDNQFAHPVEGLTAIVDVDAGVVVRVDDTGAVALPPEDSNYAERLQTTWRPGLKPLEIVQPDGPSFTVDGWGVEWCGWRFRVGFTPREGLILHDLELRDGGDWRPVVRRAALAEMVVPYGAPQGIHPRKNAFDVGDYGIGVLANSLALGCDCLGAIHYFDATLNRIDGSAHVIPNAVCLHEEDAGILWKHSDFRTGEVSVRRGRRLVISFIATVGNYEYGFYWHLTLDGRIELEIKLTGIINTVGIASDAMLPYGTVVAPGVLGQIHQHIFNVRLDMAVDGEANSVVEVDTRLDAPGPDNPYCNGFRTHETVLETERKAVRDADASALRFWKVVNRGKRNRHGQHPGYKIVSHDMTAPMFPEGSQIARRAGFALHHLWVTPTDFTQRFPAGHYVNQSEDGQGLPTWTAADRPVTDRPITVWHTFGHHHVVRPEDYPVQPVMTCGFALVPSGFFDCNPALDIPPSKSTRSCHA